MVAQPTAEELYSLQIAQLLTVVAVLVRNCLEWANEKAPLDKEDADRLNRLNAIFDFKPEMVTQTEAAIEEITDQLIHDLENNMRALQEETKNEIRN